MPAGSGECGKLFELPDGGLSIGAVCFELEDAPVVEVREQHVDDAVGAEPFSLHDDVDGAAKAEDACHKLGGGAGMQPVLVGDGEFFRNAGGLLAWGTGS